MSTFAVTAERLEILTHPNADALELAAVGGYRAVVLKGQYRTGDYALYIPEQALLPEPLVEELGLTGRLAGKAQNRVKAIRLRGELSQGIVCLPAALAGEDLAAAAAERTDFAERLGITKWVPEVPASMSGEVVAAPEFIPWIEIENIKRFPNAFDSGEEVTGSEKTHGSSCNCTLDLASDSFMVSSKGFGAKRLAILENPNNVYWRAIRVHDVEAKLRRLAELTGANKVGLFGEVYGAGIQDLTYGVASRNTPGFVVFDAYLVRPDGLIGWVDQDELRELCAAVDLAMVPELYRGPYDYEAIAAVAEGLTVVGRGAHIREGVVVRPFHERTSNQLGGRLIAKFVSGAYLVRKGDVTEFENRMADLPRLIGW